MAALNLKSSVPFLYRAAYLGISQTPSSHVQNWAVGALGARGFAWPPQTFADQLTLFQRGEGDGGDYAPQITICPPGFSNLPRALHVARKKDAADMGSAKAKELSMLL